MTWKIDYYITQCKEKAIKQCYGMRIFITKNTKKKKGKKERGREEEGKTHIYLNAQENAGIT